MDSGKDSTKASGDGFYTTTDEAGVTHRFVVRKGDTVPEGATFEAGPQKDEPKTQPAQQAQQGKTGPSETTSANPPKQTS